MEGMKVYKILVSIEAAHGPPKTRFDQIIPTTHLMEFVE